MTKGGSYKKAQRTESLESCTQRLRSFWSALDRSVICAHINLIRRETDESGN